MGTLDGKVALITGAGQGIGQGIAFAMAKAGATIVVTGRTESKLIDTCRTIESFGGVAIPLVCDVQSPEQITAVVARTVEQLGGIDILVNNAQTSPFASLNDTAEEDFLNTFETGPFATFRFMRACYPYLKASKGIIFNFTSAVTVNWRPVKHSAYASAKCAIEGLSRAAAVEWGRDGIRILTIAPHAESPGVKAFSESNPAVAAAQVKGIPMGRIGDCETDVGNALVALCAPAFGYMTGAIIPLDGGQAKFS